MKKWILILLILLAGPLFAQESDANSGLMDTDSILKSINAERENINKYAMITLGSWSVLNIGAGAIMYGRTKGIDKYFWEMNIAWNTINLTIAGFGLYSAINPEIGLGLYETIDQEYLIEKILMINMGLNIAYIATGAYLNERGRNVTKNADRLRGYGRSLMLQGAFLMLFDTSLFLIHNSNNDTLKELLQHVSVGAGSIGISIPL